MQSPPESKAHLGANYQRVSEVLRVDIFSGVFNPGDRLKINALVERYGVGANPIREALQKLQGEGLVEMTPNKGATVRYLDENVTRDMLELRQAIDEFFARRFVEFGSYQLLDKLVQVQQDFEKAVAEARREDYLDHNNVFHEVIMSAANNREAEAVLRRSSMLTRSIRRLVGYGNHRLDVIIEEHNNLIQAFKDRDADRASRIARLHAKGAADDLLEQYRRMMDERKAKSNPVANKRSRVPRGWSPDLTEKRN